MQERPILSLINELRSRKVFQVATWYAAAAWLIIQVANTVIPSFNLPAWTMQVVIVAALVGFPIAVLLAWAFDLSLSGIRRAAPAIAPAQHAETRNLVSLALAVAAGALLGAGAITGWHALDAPAERPGIAVLAFDVLGMEANQSLAGGLQEAVLDELAHLSGLRVIARTSVLRFSESKPDIREVGRILDVPYVLEGSVQREGGQLRVHAQLIDAASNEHVWSETYDRGTDDLFGVQTALARDIAGQLRVKLLPDELARSDAPPTPVPAAYQAFLEGLVHLQRFEATSGERAAASMQAAIASMDRALALDPAFALGHAERARLLLYFYLNFSDTLPEAARAREQALLAASEALRLSPNLGEAHRALGLYYYWGLFDYPSAQRELALAQETLPNDSVSAWILGLVRRRQNRFDEAVDLFREAYSLNPGDQTARETYALALLDGGRYAEADAVIADLLARFPEARDPLFGRALLHFCRTGDTGALRAAAASGLDSRDMEDYSRWLAARFEGRLEEALAVVQAGSSFTFGLDFRPWALAESYFLLDDPAAAAAAVQPQIDRIESALKAAPDQLGVDLGLPDSYLFAGQPADARRAARDLLKHTPVERSAVEYWIARAILTRTYAFLGDTEESLDLLALVQSGPERDCGNVLRHDPAFAHLRDEPRFQQITAASDWK